MSTARAQRLAMDACDEEGLWQLQELFFESLQGHIRKIRRTLSVSATEAAKREAEAKAASEVCQTLIGMYDLSERRAGRGTLSDEEKTSISNYVSAVLLRSG